MLLMGLLENYFVPLHSFYLTPTNAEQKVSFYFLFNGALNTFLLTILEIFEKTITVAQLYETISSVKFIFMYSLLHSDTVSTLS